MACAFSKLFACFESRCACDTGSKISRLIADEFIELLYRLPLVPILIFCGNWFIILQGSVFCFFQALGCVPGVALVLRMVNWSAVTDFFGDVSYARVVSSHAPAISSHAPSITSHATAISYHATGEFEIRQQRPPKIKESVLFLLRLAPPPPRCSSILNNSSPTHMSICPQMTP